MATSVAGPSLEVYSSVAPVNGAPLCTKSCDWLADLAAPDLTWVANSSAQYGTVLQRIPELFAWKSSGSDEVFTTLQYFARSVALRRLRSCFDHIAYHDQHLAQAMKSLFAKLPKVGQVRFATAPETYSHITRMHSEPVDVIVYLCNALNGEAAFRGLGEVKEGYSTALGDMYVIANPEASQSTFDKLEIIRARYLSGGITVDFGSPNTVGVQESKIKREYGTYSPDEEAIVFDRLEATLQAIEAVSSVAAQLIRSFVKVIIPLKTAAGRSSTSQPRIPGRVLIGGTERGSLAPHASSLVHEAMHQLLYTLEFGGTFITPHLDAGEARATSLWTGRDLPLHSFIHACFIWYGLSQFWGRPKAAEVFGSAFTEREFARCTAGYRNKNPVEMLLPNLGMVRYDVFKVANTLRDNLASVLTHGYHVQA